MAKRATNLSPRIANRRAFHEYRIDEKLEVGIMLTGSEVKSIRHGNVSLAEGFARVEPATLELMLFNVDIATYPQAGINNHEPKRPRKLLAHKKQIAKLLGETTAKGTTLVPLAMYFSDRGIVKVEIGVARGKQHYDKRADLKKRDDQREITRAMTRKRM